MGTTEIMETLANLTLLNEFTDALVFALLEYVAGPKYKEDGDDPIYETIDSLTEEERGVFLKGCETIQKMNEDLAKFKKLANA